MAKASKGIKWAWRREVYKTVLDRGIKIRVRVSDQSLKDFARERGGAEWFENKEAQRKTRHPKRSDHQPSIHPRSRWDILADRRQFKRGW